MVDVNTQNKTISVNVSSSGVSSNVNASGDTTLYYSNKAREWATSNRIVDGVDYSSKYYAEKSNQSALNAQSFAQSAQDSYNQFESSVADSLNTIDNKVQEATDNIDTLEQDVITEIQETSTTQKNEIKSLSKQEQNKIIDLGIDTRANVDLSNLSEDGEKHFLNKSQITNCITEIPQRIKYTLENGTLTIKAGSVAIFPYGTTAPTYNIGDTIGTNGFWKVVDITYNNEQLFYYAELQQDTQVTVGTGATVQATTVTILPTLNNTNFKFLYYTSSTVSSGTEVLTSGGVRYLTNSNLIGRYTSAWSTAEGIGLPICLATGAGVAGGGFTSVNQVFNGFGYIGSTVWVDKGVKFLCPNGRNADGTLNNIERVTKNIDLDTLLSVDSFYTVTETSLSRRNSTSTFIQEDMPSLPMTDNSHAIWFNPSTNITYYAAAGKTSWTKVNNFAIVGSASLNHFDFKQPFRAVDYNDALLKTDKKEIASWGLPSNKYINLSFGASGTTYTMQSNGWLYFLGDWNNKKTYIQLENRTRLYKVQTPEITSAGYYGLMLPVSKNDVVKVSYLAQPTNVTFRLINMEGEV